MAPTIAICNSFKAQLLQGLHNFSAVGGDVFKLALYTSAWTGDKTTTTYSALNEVVPIGSYSAGGGTLTSATPVLSGDTAVCDFADLTFAGVITARGALIYNSSKGGAAVCVLDFGVDKTSTSGTFSISFPPPDAANAILRIT
jgi:hypothetical protein